VLGSRHAGAAGGRAARGQFRPRDPDRPDVRYRLDLGRRPARLRADNRWRCQVRGWNNYGETGDQSGSTTTPEPIDVSGLPTNVLGVYVGGYHSCVVTSTGDALCWGENQVGQLGDGTTVDRATPATVSGLTGVISMTGGTYHTCAITTGGAAYCWGSNNSGQVGNGTTTDSWVPVHVVGLSSGVIQIAGGRFHTCSVDSAGRAKCWGNNLWGQLGDGTTTFRSTPVGVTGLSK
jgi:alpha-tubulin suppressor-like RCC1 family protein